MVSAVPLRIVNRMVDERILPESLISRKKGRRISADACVYISFFEGTAAHLTRESRKRTISKAAQATSPWHITADTKVPAEGWIVWEDGVGVDFSNFAKPAIERLRLLDAARQAIVSDPEILGGEPVVKGTRVPVYYVAGAIAAGAPLEEILEDYPSIDARAVQLAIAFVEANPRQGRPKSIAERFPDLVSIEHHVYPRPDRSR